MKKILLGVLISIGCLTAGVVEDSSIYKENFTICEVDKKDFACASIGMEYENNKELEKTMDYFKLACEYGMGIACSKVGIMEEVNKKYIEAISYFVKGCDLNDSSGCFYSGAKLLKVSPEKAAHLLSKGCDLDEGKACALIGVEYLQGKSLENDMDKAFEYLNKGCKLENENACGIVEIMNKAVINNHSKKCKNGESESCLYAANKIFSADKVTRADANKAIGLVDKACALKDTSACDLAIKLKKH